MFTVNFVDDWSFRDFAKHELVLASSSTPVEDDDPVSDFSSFRDKWDGSTDNVQ